MRPFFWVIALGLTACANDTGWQGTGVGNPSLNPGAHSRLHVAGEDGLVWQTATAPVARWTLVDCAGETASLELGREIDLLDSERFVLPEGAWCQAVLELEGTLHFNGTYQAPLWANPGVITVELDVAEVVIVGPFDLLPNDELVLELASPGWLDLSQLGLVSGGNLNVRPGSFGHALFADRVALGSGWFYDLDGNGVIDDQERLDGPLATGENYGSDDVF